jgi:hypothetical protein
MVAEGAMIDLRWSPRNGQHHCQWPLTHCWGGFMVRTSPTEGHGDRVAWTIGGRRRPSHRKTASAGAVSARYTEAEISDFNEKLGPGAGVALESLRKQAGIKVTVEKRGIGARSKR